MRRLTAIFYDVDDTLYSTTEFADLARQRAVEAMVAQGIRLPVERVRRELDEVISEFSSNYSHHFDKLLLRLPAHACAGTNKALLIAAGVTAYHDTKDELQPFPDVPALLRDIQQRTSLVQGVVTHGLEIKQAEKLLRLGVVPFLHPEAIFISDQVGISKPNPKLYLRACSRFELDPREVMYVGDNPSHDVDPPNGLGMITVRSSRPGTKREALVGQTEADYEVETFDELRVHLAQDFGLPLGP